MTCPPVLEPVSKRLKTNNVASPDSLFSLQSKIKSGEFKSAASLLHSYLQQVHRETPVYTCRQSAGYIVEIISKGKILATGQHPSKKNEAKRIAAENALFSLCSNLLSLFKETLSLLEKTPSQQLEKDPISSTTPKNDLNLILQRVKSGHLQSHEALLHEACVESLGQSPAFFTRLDGKRVIVEISLKSEIVATGEDTDKQKAKEKAAVALLSARFPELLTVFEGHLNSLSNLVSANAIESVFKFPKDPWERMSQKLERKIKSRAIRSLGSLLHEICTQAGTKCPLYSWEFGPNNEFVSVIKVNQSIIGRGASSESKNEAKNKAMEMAVSSVFPNLITLMSLCQTCPDLVCSDARPNIPAEFITELTSAMLSSTPSDFVDLWENDRECTQHTHSRAGVSQQ